MKHLKWDIHQYKNLYNIQMTSYTTNQVYSLLTQIQNNQHDEGYQSQIQNNYQQLIEAVTKENNIIDSTYSQGWKLNSADGQQSRYIYQSSTILENIYNYGFWIYIAVAIILCIIIVRKEMSYYMKAVLCVVILLYPFYIYPLEKFLYMISIYIGNVLLSNTYDNGYGNTNIEYGLSGSVNNFGPSTESVASQPAGSQTTASQPAGSQTQSNTHSTTPPLPTNSGGGTTPTSTIPTFQFEPQPQTTAPIQQALPVSTQVPFSYTV
jgi:hypothetical protein